MLDWFWILIGWKARWVLAKDDSKLKITINESSFGYGFHYAQDLIDDGWTLVSQPKREGITLRTVRAPETDSGDGGAHSRSE